MTIKISTGLQNGMLATGPFRTVMNLCKVNIYAGAVPSAADDSIGGATLLTAVTNDATATGLTFEATASAGTISKTLAEIWRGVNVATGDATFFRMVLLSDDGTSSTTQPRVQGTVAVAGGDMNLSSTSLTSGASQTLDFCAVALPTSR